MIVSYLETFALVAFFKWSAWSPNLSIYLGLVGVWGGFMTRLSQLSRMKRIE